MMREDLIQVGPHLYEVPPSYRADTRVPARVYAEEELLLGVLPGEMLTQLVRSPS
jgi:hypothetical protein